MQTVSFVEEKVEFRQQLLQTITRAKQLLLERQNPLGYWMGILDTDTSLTAEYIMLARYLGEEEPLLKKKAIQYILNTQNPEGGWSIYPGFRSDVSVTTKCYFALKLAGFSANDPLMIRAKNEALKMGGLHKVNVFSKVAFALFGQYSWKDIPAMPVEMVLVPRWFYFNIYEMSYWSRTITVPLSLIYTLKQEISIPSEEHISELIVVGSKSDNYEGRRGFIPFLFSFIDIFLKLYMKFPIQFLRKKAIAFVEKWMLEHFKYSEGLGAIYPAMLNSLIALKMLNYPKDHPVYQEQWKFYKELMVEEGDTLRLQPCVSPVWDTGLALNALNSCQLDPKHPAKQKAASWLMEHQIQIKGDWQIKKPNVEPGGWPFQFANDFYPDNDDSAVVVMGLQGIDLEENQPKLDETIRKATQWLIQMQNKDGGWGAFEYENNKSLLNYLPFADYGALLDPSTADVAGRVLEMLGNAKIPVDPQVIQKAIRFILKEQEAEGCWYGRWGVNYIYGTWSVLCGLKAVGFDMKSEPIQRCVSWLKSHQNTDGGWGESCYTYEDIKTKGVGKSTASQTAWALIALMSAGETEETVLRRGVDYLLQTQLENGDWNEPEMTGTGFPRILYLRYHMYRHYFPLKALKLYQERDEK
ncbi:MAG: squalene--hopene cyclase [Planctomycetota bacterium]